MRASFSWWIIGVAAHRVIPPENPAAVGVTQVLLASQVLHAADGARLDPLPRGRIIAHMAAALRR